MLTSGARISGYTIDRELGRGGMGVVYLAHDTRLNRRVAIKALPASLGSDSDRLARFEREARILASLNHPGIAAIYGLEEMGGERYLVLEHVEGESLAARLTRGPIPIDEALPLARQIAEALEAAHEKGIIHRDLKPGNVMVTPDGAVKVLDFGLARTADGPTSIVDGDSPTVTTPAPPHSPTIPGVILGTAGYMSPEQARGKPVDKRSDIFSFGSVLFEMLTGRRAFPGETASDAVGAVLHREPDWSLLPANVPARVHELLTTCLAKDRKDRLRDAGDARLAIDRAAADSPTPGRSGARPKREALAWGLALLGLTAAGGALLWAVRPRAPSGSGTPTSEIVSFTVQAPPGTTIDTESVNAAISPDGRRVTFVAFDETGAAHLWVRDFDALASSRIEGTEGAALPFWSHDSRSVGYFAMDTLWRVGIDGGAPQRLADAPGGRGGAWSENGLILFAPFADGPLHTVPQSGGPATQVLELDTASGERGHRFPQFLPGGRMFVYSSMGTINRRLSQTRTMLASLDGRHGKELLLADSRATFAAPGWMLYERSGVLYAQQLDGAAGALTGEPVATAVRPGGTSHFSGYFAVSASATGAMACPADGLIKSQIVEFGPDGKARRTLNVPAELYRWLSVSDSAQMLVADMSVGNRQELRLIDLARDGVWTRLTEESHVYTPRWSHDGKWVYFSADRDHRDLFRAAPGSPRAELVFETGNAWGAVRDVSFDGRYVAFSTIGPTTNRDMEVLDVQTKERRPLAAGPENEFDARFSPDGRLVALGVSRGRRELYVEGFPEPGARVRASVSGIGTNSGNPTEASFRWTSDGGAVLFVDADNRTVRSVKVSVENGSIRVGTPEMLMQLPPEALRVEIGPDGKSAYAVVRAPTQPPTSIAVTLNWQRPLASAPAK